MKVVHEFIGHSNILTVWIRRPHHLLQCAHYVHTFLPELVQCQLSVILLVHFHHLQACDVSGDGMLFLSSSNGFDGAGCELKIWDRRTGNCSCDCVGHTETV